MPKHPRGSAGGKGGSKPVVQKTPAQIKNDNEVQQEKTDLDQREEQARAAAEPAPPPKTLLHSEKMRELLQELDFTVEQIEKENAHDKIDKDKIKLKLKLNTNEDLHTNDLAISIFLAFNSYDHEPKKQDEIILEGLLNIALKDSKIKSKELKDFCKNKLNIFRAKANKSELFIINLLKEPWMSKAIINRTKIDRQKTLKIIKEINDRWASEYIWTDTHPGFFKRFTKPLKKRREQIFDMSKKIFFICIENTTEELKTEKLITLLKKEIEEIKKEGPIFKSKLQTLCENQLRYVFGVDPETSSSKKNITNKKR